LIIIDFKWKNGWLQRKKLFEMEFPLEYHQGRSLLLRLIFIFGRIWFKMEILMLRFHPYDRPYFDMLGFLRFRVAEMKEEIARKLAQEYAENTSKFYTFDSDKSPLLENSTKAASVSSPK
jgi:hypothetical protein